MLIAVLRRWAERYMASRKPDFVVGDNYLQRWFVIPRNNWFNIYLHRFLHDDEDEALHDHPYTNVSLVLDGGYWEHLRDGSRRWRAPGGMVARWGATPHRVALLPKQPAISLFFTGPRTREWGFHCPKGWIPWHRFINAKDYSSRSVRGKGCDG